MSKNIKIFLSFFSGLLSLFLFICILHISTPPLQNTTEEKDYLKIMKMQEKAVTANDILMSTFDSNGTLVYPDDYSGNYITREGHLVIFLTCKDNISEYNNILSDYSEIVDYEYVNYSLNDLYMVSDKVFELLSKEFEITMFGPDIINNGIIIESTSKRNENNEEIILRYFSYDNDTYYYESDYGIIPIDFNWNTSPINEEISFPGGSPMGYVSGSTGRVTMSCNVFNSDGVFGFITCGHGSIPGQVTYSGSTTIGVTSYIRYPSTTNNSVYGDFSFVISTGNPSVTSNYKYIHLPSTIQYNYVGYVNSPPIGTVLIKYGKNSGNATVTVSHTGVTNTVNLDGVTCYVKGITKATINSGYSIGGDSGGPYVFSNKYCGVHRGSNSTSVFFTPYYFVKSAGYDIYTN